MNQRLSFFFRNYLAEISLIWLSVLFYYYCPFYKGFLPNSVRFILILLASAYSLFAIPLHSVNAVKKKSSKGYLILQIGFRFCKGLKHYLHQITVDRNSKICEISKEESVLLLFTGVKFFFIPIMLRFAHTNFTSVRTRYAELLVSQKPLLQLISENYFLLTVSSLFLMDILFYVFGYLFESSILKNKIKSVDSTFLGWLVVLACYPPFNKVTSYLFPMHESFKVTYGNETITMIMQGVILLLVLIFALSSVSLGAKCSNLTNRGIVSRGTYSIVRHPAYVSKILIWWLLLLPIISGHVTVVVSLIAWTLLYGIRAITEELHLLQDDDYIKYCKKVKYRFIPGLF